MPKLAISVGDLNGVGLEIALKAHEKIKTFCEPLYCVNQEELTQASKLLDLVIPQDFHTTAIHAKAVITPSLATKESGYYSFASFKKAVELAETKQVDAICTLPINKEAWSLAGIAYKGHTDALRDFFDENAIMMLGCESMYVALYTEHVPYFHVPKYMNAKILQEFLLTFYKEVKEDNIAVLGLNPHAGDNCVLGSEEQEIAKAIKEANTNLGKEVFKGPLVPDTAFTPHMRQQFKTYVCMYHDQGLIPLKTLYFDESINVSLNLPIIRTSVDHGTAFDIAYKDKKAQTTSYLNAIKSACAFIRKKNVCKEN